MAQADNCSSAVNSFGDSVLLTTTRLNLQTVVDELSGPTVGAKALFVGTTRDSFEGRPVTYLSYEAYTSLATKTMLEIISEARRTNASTLEAPDSRVVIHHLLGECPIGETSIIIGVSSAGRVGAFELCQDLLERVKKDVQIWKREHYGNGDEPCWKENFPTTSTLVQESRLPIHDTT